MKLTNYSDYALRSLIYLAIKPKNGELSNIDDIARAYDISKSHLTKIIHQLGKLGYIESVRGKGGGIRLGVQPEDINIGQLVRHTESDFEILQCLEHSATTGQDSTQIPKNDNKINVVIIGQDAHNNCVISPACHLKGVFHQAMLAFIKVLDGYTLADVITNPDELLELFKT